MDWYSVDITEARVADGEYHRLCRRFQQAFIAAGAPPQMAMFAQTAVRDNLRKVYFSPGSVPYISSLIEQFRAAACGVPDEEEVTLVFGVPGAGHSLLETGHLQGDGALLYEVSEELTPVRRVAVSAT